MEPQVKDEKKEMKPEEVLAKSLENMKSTISKNGLGEEAIAKLNEEYKDLAITDLTDVAQYDRVHEALQVVKKSRIGIEKFCKANRDGLNLFVKAISAEEKRLLGLIEPLELHLFNERKKVEDEKQRIANEEKLAFENKMNDRIKTLGQYGKIIDFAEAVAMDDLTYSENLEAFKLVFENAEREKAAKAEEDRLEGIRLEEQKKTQEAEADRLKKLAEENERKEKELQEKQDKLNEDKFTLRLGNLAECTFNGTSLYLSGELFATRQELIEMEEDRFHGLKKIYTDKMNEKAENDAKTKKLEIENAKKEEDERLKKQLIESRVKSLAKYEFEVSDEGEYISTMTEDEFISHIEETKNIFEQREAEMKEEEENKKEALKSDLEKLSTLSILLEKMSEGGENVMFFIPKLDSEDANKIASEIKSGLSKLSNLIREKIKK